MAIAIDSSELARFFIAILLLLFSAHLFGQIFGRFSMPKVVGEIFGGLLLGPTFLGYFAPNIYSMIFLDQGKLIAAIYWLGLVLLMFSSGFEIERELDRKDKKTIVWLVIGTTAIPLVFGWISTYFFNISGLIGTAGNVLSLKLVIAVAIGITSIPVISKIFLDLGIIKTRFAKIVLATATIHDVILWVFISIAVGLVSSNSISFGKISLHVIVSAVFFVIALFAVPKLIKFVDKLRIGLVPKGSESAFIALILLMFTVAASLLGVNLVFGAFLAGIAVNYIKNPRFQDSKKHIKNFSMAFFIPLYFAIVGIKIDLIRNLDIGFFLVFFLFAAIVQTIAVLLTARLLKYNWLSSFNLAAVLNNRGGPCIVLATIAFDIGIINENFFVTLVLLAIVTSLTAGAWLKYVLSRKMPLLG